MPQQRYSKYESKVFIFIMFPYQLALNLILFGTCFLSSLESFASAFVISSLYIFGVYWVFGLAAVQIKNKFSAPAQLFRRISVMLPFFYLMNALTMLGIILLHRNFSLVSCPVKEGIFWWALLYGCIMSTVITLINEGLSNWENWKSSLAENERLKNVYQRSKLLGLKGQLNPHFLFNCFNTLSGLIHEDEKKAETFLEEMTKVHRYLLRSDEELLVPLADEIKFTESYLHLAQTRFGQGIDATIKVDAASRKKFLPPLSMQVILENIIYTNAISKNNPLTIYIKNEGGKLQVHHTIHEKAVAESLEVDEGLDNLLTKFRLLNAPQVTISEALGNRMFILPLLQKNNDYEMGETT